MAGSNRAGRFSETCAARWWRFPRSKSLAGRRYPQPIAGYSTRRRHQPRHRHRRQTRYGFHQPRRQHRPGRWRQYSDHAQEPHLRPPEQSVAHSDSQIPGEYRNEPATSLHAGQRHGRFRDCQHQRPPQRDGEDRKGTERILFTRLHAAGIRRRLLPRASRESGAQWRNHDPGSHGLLQCQAA